MSNQGFDEFLAELDLNSSSPATPAADRADRAGSAKEEIIQVASRNIDPIDAAQRIDHDYRRFLKTLLAPKTRSIVEALNQAVDTSETLTKGPLVELTLPYAPGRSIQQLADAGVVSKALLEIGDGLPPTRPLYKHQEAAIEKLRAGRNLIVSTGTGSGKTESFLIPIIDSLLREKEEGTLSPGVRALLLYPMNALANDQIKRLRELLANYPDITFGRYTGETEQEDRKARNLYLAMNEDEEPLPNELISRDAMQKTPPNILLTNYAMLEYLLLRPSDSALFDGQYGNSWSYIVLDEAHVYAGAQGTEVGMLLRRVKDRVRTPGRSIQCIATSASLQGEEQEIMDFGSSLFDAPFEYDATDPARQDLVKAQRKQLPAVAEWSLDDELFDGPDATERLRAALASHAEKHSSSEFDALITEQHVVTMRLQCRAGSQYLGRLASLLWPGAAEEQALRRVHHLIMLGSSTTDPSGIPAISARYHMFVKATEGAFIRFNAEDVPVVSLNRQVKLPVEEGGRQAKRPVYEMATCKSCGSVHLLGRIDNGSRFSPPEESERDDDLTWALLDPVSESPLYNEDDEVESETDLTKYRDAVGGATFYLCCTCGKLREAPDTRCGDCQSTAIHPVKFYDSAGKNSTLEHCLECGARSSNQLLRLLTDRNLTPATLTGSLYQLLPPAAKHEFEVGQGRKLLTFSDSRQAAAYAAPYLMQQFNKNVERRVMLQALADHSSAAPITLPNWATATAHEVRDKKIVANGENTDTDYWVYGEATSVERNRSLEGLGLASYGIIDSYWAKLSSLVGLLKRAIGDEKSTRAYIDLLLGELRRRGALDLSACTEFGDSHFLPRRGGWACRKDSGGDRAKMVYSWLPAAGRSNYRLELTKKALLAGPMGSNFPVGSEDADAGIAAEAKLKSVAERILEQVWDWLFQAGVLTKSDYSAERGARVISAHAIGVRDGSHEHWYQCTVCGSLTPHNCLDLCASASCSGRLQEIDTSTDEFTQHYYRWLARNMNMQALRAREHTAQLTAKHAAEVQKSFIDGQVNVLSCSTTFELGVDVGELQTVMMRNIPPRTANYVQRAGRAGRRAGSAAFVLTFARRAAHDMAIYQHPERMIDGLMRTPYLTAENPRIVTRHCYSVIFAAFLRENAPMWPAWKAVRGLFLKTENPEAEAGKERMHELMSAYLCGGLPGAVRDALARIVPKSLAEEIGIDDGRLVTGYLDLIETVQSGIQQEWDALNEVREEAHKNRTSTSAFDHTIRTLETQQTLSFMASRNLLPKYGFPVDTVEMDTKANTRDGGMIDLNRDLSLAIGDYAPGSSVVANGLAWTSAGVKVLPGRGLPHGFLHVCENCNEVNFQSFIRFKADAKCPHCKQTYRTQQIDVLQPVFGFVANKTPREIGGSEPQKFWAKDSYIVDSSDNNVVFQHSYEYGTGADQTVVVSARKRSKILALNQNNGRQFLICQECGGEVERGKRHRYPRTDRVCGGRADRVALGHLYETDLATIKSTYLEKYSPTELLSALYALLESASVTLELNRDDIDGTLAWFEGKPHFVLFDAVPGGAGITKEVVAHFDEVLRAAIERVKDCECAPDTSCYACLRSYGNQRYHEVLRRSDAEEVLRGILPVGSHA